jgi:hypothetical protein
VGVDFTPPGWSSPATRNDARSLDDVNRVTVAVQNPAATTSTVTGALTIEEGSHTQVLPATELASLPQHTLDVTFEAAEVWVGGRPLLISLSEDGTSQDTPRLVTDGDVKGGRYVSGVVDLVVGQGQPPGRSWWGGR